MPAKPTKAALAKQIEALQAQMDEAEPDEEVWLKDESGTEVRVTGQRASTVLGRFAHLWEADDAGEEGDGEEGDEQDPPPNADSIFRRGGGKPKDKA